MRVSDVMSRCVTVCTEDAGLEEVYELMQKCEHKLVVVVDSHAHRVPIGVTSEHSICEQVIARGRNPRTLSAGSAMDARIKKVSEDQLLENIGAEDLDRLTALIVVNADRQIIGLVSKEVIKRAAVVAKDRTVTVTINAAPATPQRVSEIPAFGWIQ
jgi:predicted transcriptional regulator